MSNENKMSQMGLAQQTSRQKQLNLHINPSQLIWLLLGILETLIALRIGLMLFGANPGNPIISLIYGSTSLLLFPLAGSIVAPVAGSMVLEISSLFAMMIYTLVAMVLEKVIWMLTYHPVEPLKEPQTAKDEQEISYRQRSAKE